MRLSYLRGSLYEFHPDTDSPALCVGRLSTIVGRPGPGRILCMGTDCPQLLHPSADRPQDMANHPLREFWDVSAGTVSRNVQRDRYIGRVGTDVLLVFVWQSVVPDRGARDRMGDGQAVPDPKAGANQANHLNGGIVNHPGRPYNGQCLPEIWSDHWTVKVIVNFFRQSA